MKTLEVIRDSKVSLLCNMFGWGYLDVERLLDILEVANEMGIDSDELREYMSDCEMATTDVNSWIFVGMDRINSAIFDLIAEDESFDEAIRDKAAELRDDFSPFINFMDSHFNNVLDEFSLGELSLKEDFIKKLSEVLK